MYRNHQDAQYQPLQGVFSGGLVDNLHNEDIKDACTPYARNWRIEGVDACIRPGYQLLSSCPGSPINHMGYWHTVDDNGTEKDRLIIATTLTDGLSTFDLSTNTCSVVPTLEDVAWMGPHAGIFCTTDSNKTLKFQAQSGSFIGVIQYDNQTPPNITQQFDPSGATDLKGLLNYVEAYPASISDWNMVANGTITITFPDGNQHTLNVDCSTVTNTQELRDAFTQAYKSIPCWESITEARIKINGNTAGPFDFSTCSNLEDVALVMNAALLLSRVQVEQGINQYGLPSEYLVIYTLGTITTVERATTGSQTDNYRLWSFLSGNEDGSNNPSHTQDIGVPNKKLHGKASANQYFIYGTKDSTQNGFLVIDRNDEDVRYALLPNKTRPSFGEIFDGFHFTAGDPQDPELLHQSVRGYYEDFENPGSDQYRFDGPITTIHANNHELYVFTKTSIGVLSAGGFTQQGGIYRYNIQQLEVQEGCVHHGAAVGVGYRTFFWTPSNKIREVSKGGASSGYQVRELTHRDKGGIDRTMKNAIDPVQPDVFGLFIPQANIIKWFCRSMGATQNDMAIIYDVENDAFLVDTYSHTFCQGTHDANNAYLMRYASPQIILDETGSSDIGQAINFEYHTKRMMYGDPTLEKQFTEARHFLEMGPNSNITYGVYVNGDLAYTRLLTNADGSNTAGNDFYTGQRTEICHTTTKGMLRKKGKNIQFKYNTNLLNARVCLKNVIARMLPLSPETSNRNISKY